ncbi:MAG: hypothetical protein EWM51_03590 [Treponema sp.]|nr:MAG: hypothetical protein EWM51_03590 [Treponema sp.]
MKSAGGFYKTIRIDRHPAGGWSVYGTAFGYYLPGRFSSLADVILAIDNAQKAALRLANTRPSGAVKPDCETGKEVYLVAVDRRLAVICIRRFLKSILDLVLGSLIVGILAFFVLVAQGWTP